MHTSKFTHSRKRLIEDLKLAGYADRTQKSYLERVTNLANYFDQCPSELSDEQVRDYLLHIVNDRNYAANSLRITNAGLKFFYRTTLKREIKLLGLNRVIVSSERQAFFLKYWQDSLLLPQKSKFF